MPHPLKDHVIGTIDFEIRRVIKVQPEDIPASFFRVGYNDWERLRAAMTAANVEPIEPASAATDIAERYALIGLYLKYRTHGADLGHERALKRAKKELKPIRKALGYAYP